MTIPDESLLDVFRGPGRCEWCGKHCQRREPHHVTAKGMGGGRRLDIPINLVALGSSLPFPVCTCHGDVTDGRLMKADMLAVIAAREQCLQDDIERAVYLILRLPKRPTQAQINRELGTVNLGTRELVNRSLGLLGRENMPAPEAPEGWHRINMVLE